MERNTKFEGMALMALTVMLVGVFLFSIKMYDQMETETRSGTLSVFAENVRTFLDENEAVAAFLGFEEESAYSTEVAEKATEYIERYNAIYASAK